MSPALFALVILDLGSHFWPGEPGLCSSYFMFSAIAEMTGMGHHTQLLVEMGFHKVLPRLLSNWDPPYISLPSI
jgi:hypothetical protein